MDPPKRMVLKQQGLFNKQSHIFNKQRQIKIYRMIKYQVVYRFKIRPKDKLNSEPCLCFKAVSSFKMLSKYWQAKTVRCKWLN